MKKRLSCFFSPGLISKLKPQSLVMLVLFMLPLLALAQDVLSKKISIKVKNEEIREVLSRIEQQVNVNFVYSPELVQANRKVSIEAKQKELAAVLGELLTPLNIDFELANGYIVLSKKQSHNLANVQTVFKTIGANETAQDFEVSGTVINDAGEPLPSISVTEKGTANGVSTSTSGNFRLLVADKNATLVFTGVGYAAQQVIINGSSSLKITLQPEVKALNEVVVIGYGTSKKKDLTGAVGSINNKDLKSLPVPSVGEAMQGRAAGLQVISSGSPGSNVTIRIRGTGTINNSDPLLVIDGVPTDIPLNTISPDDIANIEILKDASAAAIYGSRGANGVVLITTKKGSAGKNTLEFKMFAGTQQATNMVKMLDATQFASLHNEMMANNGQTQNPAFANPPSLGKGTDWLDALFRSAPIQNYSLAYSGGDAKSNYYVSGAVLDQQGIVINTSYRRYNVQFNSESKVFDWLKFGNNLTLNHDVKKNGSYDIRNTMAALPTQPVYNADGSYSGPVGQSSWYGDIANPVGKATLNENTTKGYNVLGSIYTEINLLKDLKFKSTGGVQASFWDLRSWSPKYDWEPIPQPESNLFEQYNKSLTWLWDNYLTYDTYFGDKNHLTVMAGSSAQNNRFDYLNGSVQNFANDQTQQINNGTNPPTLGGSASEWSLLSFIGRANYVLNDKYLFTATLRRDGSSRFGENNRWGWFPSGSVAWRISDEAFMKDITWMSDLKLRVGYGITGNQNIGNYSFASSLQTVRYTLNGTLVNAVVPLAIPNPSVRWEEVEQSNVGLDASLFKGRISLTVDAYLKNTNNMLVPMAVPISTGYSDIYVPSVNAGKVQNKGIEFNLSTDNIRQGDFRWTTNFNLSVNKNKVISLNDSVPLLTGSIGLNQNLAIQKAGLPVNAFYGFVTNGIFQTDKEVSDYAVQVPGNDPYNRTSPGDIKFRDLNNDGVIDDADRTYIGNPNPRYIFAMNNTFSWKGIDLGIFLQGIQGNNVFNANRIYQEGMSVAQNQTTAVLDRWTATNTSSTLPRAVFNDPNKNTRVSDRFVEDGSYLRIKNVTLGYNLPKHLIEHIRLQTARIYLSAQNLFTFTDYTGFDPEVNVSGIDFNVYPVTRTISAGVNLIF